MVKNFQVMALGLLLQLSAFAMAQDVDIFQAARSGDIAGIQAYAKGKGDLNARNEKGFTPVIVAAYNQHPDAVKTLIGQGANPCLADSAGQTALMGVAFHGTLETARLLLDNHCDINATSRAGQTALMFAAMFGRYEMAEFLLKRGAKTNLANIQGKTAIDLAASQGNEKMIQLIKGRN